jgi:predicted aconitase with swiveling domain
MSTALPFRAEILVPGSREAEARGPALAMTRPISFWGGVDPSTGRVIDARHPQRGESVAGKVLMLPGTIGSSSAAAVMLELVHAGLAPAAILMHEPDAILLLGCLVAREMGWASPPALRVPREIQPDWASLTLAVTPEGIISQAVGAA